MLDLGFYRYGNDYKIMDLVEDFENLDQV